MSRLPGAGMMIGDPVGVGPDVCARAATAPEQGGLSRPVQGKLLGLILAPVGSVSVKATGRITDIDQLQPANTYKQRTSGTLRGVPLVKHVPLIDTIAIATPQCDGIFAHDQQQHENLNLTSLAGICVALAGLLLVVPFGGPQPLLFTSF